jgi:crossover junction endodeoxyribonuclease RuvC
MWCSSGGRGVGGGRGVVKLIIGVDPGLGGAIAFLDVDEWTLQVWDMPTLKIGKTNKRSLCLHTLAEHFRSQSHHVILEQVHAMPGQGVTSMFNFGKGYGSIEAMLVALHHSYTKVTPQRWKKVMVVPASKDGARARASELMPLCANAWKLKKHDGRAEAALMAFWWCSKNIKYPEPIRLIVGN